MTGTRDWVLADAEATTRLGAAIAPRLSPGETVLLYGPLGMGKSTLARGLIRAMTRPEEAAEIGLDEALDEGCAVIEWPERLGDDPAAWLGPDRLTVTLAEAGEGRHASVSGAGAWEAKLKDLHV